MPTLWDLTILNSFSINVCSSASGITSFTSAIKKPADKELESVATILPSKPAILKALMVLMPAGPADPGTRIVEVINLDKLHNQLESYKPYNL